MSEQIFTQFSFLIFLLILIPGCNRKEDMPPQPIATIREVDPRLKPFIDDKDFLYSYEFTPSVNAQLKGVPAKKAHLELMLDRKLLAMEGLRRGLDQHEDAQNAISWYKARAIRQQLYRNEVKNQVVLTEQELREAFLKYKISIRVRHLPASSEQQALALRNKLLAGATTFEALAPNVFKNSTLAYNGGDLGFIKLGELDESLETAAYALKIGEISKPVKSKWAYHILQLVDKRSNPLLTENEFQQTIPRLRKILSMRKQERLADQYIRDFMQDKHVRVYGPSLVFLVEKAREFMKSDELLPQFAPPPNDLELGELRARIEDRLDEVLAVFEGGQWTIDDFLQKLKKVRLDARPRMVDKHNLKDVVARMIRDDFLLQEGLRRELDQTPYVHEEVQYWTEQVLYLKMKNDLLDSVRVSLKEIKAAYQERKMTVPLETMRPKLEATLMVEKQNAVLQAFLANLRQRHKIIIDEQTLAAVKTTDDIARGTKIQMFGVRVR